MSRSTDLPGDVVDVWEMSLDPGDAQLSDLMSTLSQPEIARADRFANERGRTQYLISRALQRKILASYTGESPRDVRFSWRAQGKPVLANNPLGMSFNTTHSGNLTLLAVSKREVGIDVEHMRSLPRALAVAKRFFSPQEHEMILALPEAERERAFLTIWTRREGGAKARGMGVWRGLHSWDNRVDPNDGSLPPGHGPWATQMLDVGDEYVGAVIASGDDWRIRYRNR